MSNTYVSVMCYTASGDSRIFAVDATDSTSSYAELVDVITGNSIGDSLQGQTVVKALASCENFLYSPGGIVFVDNQNNVLSAVGAENPEQFQPSWQSVNIPIALNYKVKCLSQASVA
jgi:hypothetical protein